MHFVNSYANDYSDIAHIIDVYFGKEKSEKLDEITATISALETDFEAVANQMGVILRKEKSAFAGLQFTISTHNEIALDVTARMLHAFGVKHSD